MNKLKTFVILLILFPMRLYGTFNHNFCIKTEMVCTGKYNWIYEYSETCTTADCSVSKYKFECDSDMCSRDKSDCDNFEHIKFMVHSIGLNDNVYALKVKKNLTSCPIIQNKPSQNDVCLSGKKCYRHFYNARLNLLENLKIKCPCLGALKYKCGLNLCTRNSLECNYVMKNSMNFKNSKKCENYNTLIPSFSFNLFSKIF